MLQSRLTAARSSHATARFSLTCVRDYVISLKPVHDPLLHSEPLFKIPSGREGEPGKNDVIDGPVQPTPPQDVVKVASGLLANQVKKARGALRDVAEKGKDTFRSRGTVGAAEINNLNEMVHRSEFQKTRDSLVNARKSKIIEKFGPPLPEEEWQVSQPTRNQSKSSQYVDPYETSGIQDPSLRESREELHPSVLNVAAGVMPGDIHKAVLSVKRVSHTVKIGRVPGYTAIVVVGNGLGCGGWGYGNAPTPHAAIQAAQKKALKRLIYVDRYLGRSLYTSGEVKVHKTRLLMWAAAPGVGLKCEDKIQYIMRCFGIQDCRAKVKGSKNPLALVEAVFKVLESQVSPQELALEHGLKYIDVRKRFLEWDGESLRHEKWRKKMEADAATEFARRMAMESSELSNAVAHPM